MERLDNSVLLCLADVLPRSDLKNLAATCQKLYLVLIRQLYVDDIRSGHRQALSWACDAGVLSTVERCLELGAPIDDTFRDGHDYYHVHAVGHASWLHYVDNYRDCSQARGLSPLIVAVASGQVEVVRYLLKSGADPNKSSVAMERGEPPESPLQWAVLGLARQCDKPKCHRYEVLKALLEAGADPNARDYGQGDELWAFRWDETEPAVHAYPYPLHLAMEATFKNEECPPQAVDLLLRHGAQALAKGNPRDAPPGSAAWSQALLWHLKEYASVGGYWQKGHVYRESAYTFAEKLRLVLERFPGALVPDDWVELLAILAGRPRFHTVLMLKAALDHGYDPNARLRRHRDPAEDGAIRIVLWALRHSAKTIERFFPYLEVMDCAIDMLRILLAAGGECSAFVDIAFLATAVSNDEEDDPRIARHRKCVDAVMELFRQYDADPNATDENGETLLHRICSAHIWPGCVVPRSGRSTLELLLRLGADVNMRDASGSTALHTACSGYGGKGANAVAVADVWLVGVLLQFGADADALDAAGRTPIDLLHLDGQPAHPADLEAVNLLLRHQANRRAAPCREEVEPHANPGVEVDEDGGEA